MERKYSVSVDIIADNGFHVDFSIRDAEILTELKHEQATRGHMGSVRTNHACFVKFVERLRPHIIYIRKTERVTIGLLRHMYKIQAATAGWDSDKLLLRKEFDIDVALEDADKASPDGTPYIDDIPF